MKQPILLLLLLHLFLIILIIAQVFPFSHCCHDEERNALLNFKSYLIDPSNHLSSWQVGKNCCSWEGIQCSNDSFHVVSVDLQNPDPYNSYGTALTGAISPSLFNLSHLRYLDLSYNNFNFSKIPYQIGNLKHLTHLDLSNSQFSGSITTQFANLSSLRYLDVSCSILYVSRCSVSSTDTSWLRGLDNLKELRLKGVDLNSTIPIQLSNLTSLSILDLDKSQLQAGSLPYLPPQLKELRIRENPYLGVNLFSLISNASLLKYLDASESTIQGSLSSITNLSQLEYLFLHRNNITGQIPSSMSSNHKNLKYLGLFFNNLQGPIPESLCEMSSLESLDLGKNSIEGTVSLISLINNLNLTYIDLSSNRITVEINDQHPPLPSKLQQLQYLHLGRCNIKGFNPGYFCNMTNLFSLDLYNTSITGTIPSCFSNLQNLVSMDLSRNNLQGTIPHSFFSNLTHLWMLDLSSNNLRGHLPLPPQSCLVFDLSKNKFTGGILIEVGEKLSNVGYISLSDNKLSGSIPSSICSNEYSILQSLDLSINQLRGTIPSSIQNCSSLVALNLGYNNISGSIPTFIGSLHNLKILYLRSNKFNGLIPKEITHLHQLQILDLSINNLSGPIPLQIAYLEMLRSRPNNRSLIPGKNSIKADNNGLQLQMVIKGTMISVERLYNYNSGIDLSCNNIEGNIPQDIGLLKGLAMLNLSHNCLSGRIPTRVGNMIGLESLDLSFNKLSEDIPESLATIDFLGYLNLSYNNLSGRIPKGHLETLSGDNGSTYFGNYWLCGPPTNKSCHVEASLQEDENAGKDVEDDDAKEKLLFYGVVFLGFGVGFGAYSWFCL